MTQTKRRARQDGAPLPRSPGIEFFPFSFLKATDRKFRVEFFPKIQIVSAISTLYLLMLSGSGCNPSGPAAVTVSGQVNLEGNRLPDGYIIFENSVMGVGVSAPIQDGQFEFKEPVPKGTYKVAFQPLTGSPSNPVPERTGNLKIPEHYRNSYTSKLEVDIQKPVSDLDFQLLASQSKVK